MLAAVPTAQWFKWRGQDAVRSPVGAGVVERTYKAAERPGVGQDAVQ